MQSVQVGTDVTYRFDDIVNQLLRLVDLLLRVRHDQTMEILLLVAGVSCVRTSFALFHRAFATDSDLRTGLGLHLLQSIASRANK